MATRRATRRPPLPQSLPPELRSAGWPDREVDYWSLGEQERAELREERRRWRQARSDWCAAHGWSVLDLFAAEHPIPAISNPNRKERA